MGVANIKIENMNKKVILTLVVIGVLALTICFFVMYNKKNAIGGNEVNVGNSNKIDSWEFDNKDIEDETVSFSSFTNKGMSVFDSISSSSVTGAVEASDATIGFSTGGAKDVENFRKNIENGYFPLFTDITYNGIFYDYAFDTGKSEESDELFYPSYSTAISRDPISEEDEFYMTVGLNSNIKESDFSRKKLNLVVVLDISGSMSSPFDSYYYDLDMEDKEDKDLEKSKMEIANESVNILIDQLNDDDRFGMVLFDDQSYIGTQIKMISEMDVDAIKEHILEIDSHGGTNFESGYTRATELLSEYQKSDANEYENRIIVITDAMPNTGDTSKEGLVSYIKENAEIGTYTTFIGVGVDFNSELTETLSDVRGANYYSVHNSDEFKKRMGEQFEYMVTPLVFDLKMDFDSTDYEIEAVYGSDTVNKEAGNIMKVNTLFPSKTESTGEVKGGVILLKLKKKNENENGDIILNVSYEDRKGEQYSNSQVVEFNMGGEYYENTGIRKAIVLTRYVNVLKNWILYERSEDDRFIYLPTNWVLLEDEVYQIIGEHERTSVELSVSETYKEIFEKIKYYIEAENEVIEDENLNQEIDVLNELILY